MLSHSAKYALKATLYLALHSSESNRIMVKDMYETINVPQAYLSKILQTLSRQKLLSSLRGPKGGFYLSEENRRVRLIEIIRLIDGDHRINSCVLSIHSCNLENPCPMHHLVNEAKSRLLKDLTETTVQDLVEDIQLGKSFLPL